MSSTFTLAAKLLNYDELQFGSILIDIGHEKTCTAISKTRPCSGQFTNHGTRAKCPDELIGRNSVIPWMTASTKMCSTLNVYLPFIVFVSF